MDRIRPSSSTSRRRCRRRRGDQDQRRDPHHDRSSSTFNASHDSGPPPPQFTTRRADTQRSAYVQTARHVVRLWHERGYVIDLPIPTILSIWTVRQLEAGVQLNFMLCRQTDAIISPAVHIYHQCEPGMLMKCPCHCLTTTRSIPVLSLLARGARLLRGQQQRGGRVGQKEVLADAGGLLRVLAPQEGGPYSNYINPESSPFKPPGNHTHDAPRGGGDERSTYTKRESSSLITNTYDIIVCRHNRPPESKPSKLPIAKPKQKADTRPTHRRPDRYATWESWVRRRIPGRCWDRNKGMVLHC